MLWARFVIVAGPAEVIAVTILTLRLVQLERAEFVLASTQLLPRIFIEKLNFAFHCIFERFLSLIQIAFNVLYGILLLHELLLHLPAASLRIIDHARCLFVILE